MSEFDGLDTLFTAIEPCRGTGKLTEDDINRLKLRQPEFTAPVAVH